MCDYNRPIIGQRLFLTISMEIRSTGIYTFSCTYHPFFVTYRLDIDQCTDTHSTLFTILICLDGRTREDVNPTDASY